ncbi:MAG: zinc-binding alcohol dehydrogenase [Betaproteobacteria bacterium]|nr:zinc-binding alcohol dehydrogenase [Betaproteobacteria bacterium]MSQ88236.1 zinc-binding alcohol dehydrogenase [Betaproteobacteria bacterium]
MKSWFIASGKDNTTLELRDVPVPEPKAGELLARVKAAGLNRGEFIAGHGLAASMPGAPKAGGIEAAGEVVKVGEGVQAFKPGDRVMGRAFHAYSEFAMFRIGDAMAAPAKLSWEEAAGASIAYLTAYDMLWPGGQLRAGEWLLVAGASAGVGVASVQLGKLLGAQVIGTSGSAEKLKKLGALGMDLGLQNRNGGFEKAILQATAGKGVDVVVNNVGGSVLAECLRVMAYQGRLAMVGYVDGVLRADIDIQALHSKRLRLYGVSNKMRSAAEIAEGVRGFERDVLPAIASGQIRPVIDKVFAFSELPQAKAHMEANAHLGKIVLRGV